MINWENLEKLERAVGRETSGSGSELSEKRRTILYRDRPLAEIYTGTRIGTDD